VSACYCCRKSTNANVKGRGLSIGMNAKVRLHVGIIMRATIVPEREAGAR